VHTIVPKYAAVKGSLGADMRCRAYVIGPWRIAHEDRKSNDPTVQLITGRAPEVSVS